MFLLIYLLLRTYKVYDAAIFLFVLRPRMHLLLAITPLTR